MPDKKHTEHTQKHTRALDLTDSEIKKALECCGNDKCSECPLQDGVCSEKDVIKSALDLINRQEAEVKHLDIESDALRADLENINRICDEKQAENESLKAEVERLKSMNQAKLDTIHDLQAEIERLKLKITRPDNADPMDFCGVLCDYAEEIIAKAKAEAYKEFAERVKEKKMQSTMDRRICTFEMIDNLLNELVGDSDGENN